MTTKSYTCKDYREEMMLLGLKKRLNNAALSEDERRLIKKQIEKIEKKMEFD
jgi:hypothetical protein